MSLVSGRIPLNLGCQFMHTHHFLKPHFALFNLHATILSTKYHVICCPTSNFFFLVVVKTVIYLLLPYHPLQKNTCLRINGHIFLIKWWITIMLVSKWIWLYKPCKSVCSHKKAHMNTSSALEQTKGKTMGDTDLGAPSLLLASPKLRAGHLKVCRTWAIRSDLFTPHKKQTAMFIPDYSEMVFESS